MSDKLQFVVDDMNQERTRDVMDRDDKLKLVGHKRQR